VKFINRETELKALEERWASDTAQLFIIYGKRRVGKTELIKQFIKDKQAVYFLASQSTEKEQLQSLGRAIGGQFGDPALARNGFAQWLDVFEYLKKNIKERFVLAIDEYPYLAEADKAVSSLFQKGWDEFLKESNIFLILSGSSIAMMESETLIYSAPLFGRRTGQLLLKPLAFRPSWQFFPNKSFNDFLEIYAITGGMPAYLAEFNPKSSIKANILDKIFLPTAYLFNEVDFILRQELREPKNYMAILKAVAFGKTKLGNIVNETGLDKNLTNKYLSVLERLQIVEREFSVTESLAAKSRKGLYKLCDNFVRFWFQYVYLYKSDLEIGRHDEPLRKIKENFSVLESIAYEDICLELAREIEGGLFYFERAGKWWDKNEEIDVVALNSETKEILFGEAKWSQKMIGTDIYENLKRKARLVDWNRGARKEHYALFSKSAFTKDMVALAKEENVKLVHRDKLIL